MASVEDRIVQMQFDNTSFERRLATTVQSLEKLNTTLATAGAKNGLEQLATSANRFNLSGMSASIEGVSAKFLALSTIGITALSNLVNRAMDAGVRMIKALSLDPVIEGFREYELQIGSIQTILANTSADGTNLEQVNSALDQLNEYSDKTIYNFAEMTRNIGTFTAAGVDLDLSVQSIKGIANVAAISGSNSQQASTAMYQLSQAIAAGSVKLMDWNSVVNAGMGGEVFQKALFTTGQMMGTIANSPIGQSFEEWTAAGNTFRGSLETGWLTAEVLTTTLKGFTGEMTKAQVMALGYTEEQADEIMRLGQLGVDSATKVRTLTQLIATTKEALQSGWSQSWRILIGDFEEATELFTNISDALGEIIGGSADARNALLQGWADMGGRQMFLDGLLNIWSALKEAMTAVKDAFRDIFPAMTVERLIALTQKFKDFTQDLRLGEETIENLRAAFRGVFSVFSIGGTVIKELIGFVKDLFVSFTGAGSGNFLSTIGTIGDFFTNLQDKLVKQGGIAKFFDNLSSVLSPVAGFLREITSGVIDFVSALGKGGFDAAGEGVNRLGERFENLKNLFSSDFWAPIKESLGGVGEALETVWITIRDWFSELGGRIAEIFGPGDFDNVVDSINVGLLGGILLALRRFFSNGLSLDFGGGFMEGVTGTFEELTGVLSAMQAEIKSNALLKIAAALSLLTVSVLLLATVDSGALARALTAMAVGFGQLIGAFAILNTLALGPRTAVQLGIVAGGMILLSAAMLLLASAVKKLSKLSLGELLKGLAGVAVLMGVIVAAATGLSNASGSYVKMGLGLIGVAIALNVLAKAVEKFSSFSWDELIKGMAGIGGALIILTAAMHALPDGMASKGAGILLVAVGLRVLANAVKAFSKMSWDELIKGMAGLGGALIILSVAIRAMPNNMASIGVGLVLVAAAITLIGNAIETFSEMTWDEMIKGMAGLGGALIILSVATTAMTGSLAGAAAIAVVSGAILLLANAVEEIGSLGVGTLITGLLGLAAALAIVAGAGYLLTPVTPGLLAFGAAMLLLGAGFALFGVGALAVAKGFELIARVGGSAILALGKLIAEFVKYLPTLAVAFGNAIVELVKTLIAAAPVFIEGFGIILSQLLVTINELIPDVLEVFGTLISGVLTLIRDKIPEFVTTGFDLLVGLLTGVRDNIEEVTTLVSDIVTKFLDAFAEKIPDMVDSVVGFLQTMFLEVANGLGELVPTMLVGVGTQFLQGLWTGIKMEATRLYDTIKGIIRDAINWVKSLFGINSPSRVMMEIGRNVIQGLINGVVGAAVALTRWFISLPGRILGWIGNVAKTLWNKGLDLIGGLLGGIKNKAIELAEWLCS